MNVFDHALALLRDPNVSSGFTVMAHGRPGWTVDVKHQIVAVGPAETMALAQVGVGLPARVELVKATLEKQAQAMTPAQPLTPQPMPANAKPWFWFAVGTGGLLAGVLLTLLLTRRSRAS